jgi:hypothetical protein
VVKNRILSRLATSGLVRRSPWVYVLPILHLCACLVSMAGYVVPSFQNAAGTLWEFITMSDLPLSFFAYALAWKHGVLATIWIVTIGTLWWYLISCGIEVLIGKIRDRGPMPENLIPKDKVDPLTERSH